jgi:outer membrane protein assembly factor BamD (BamD/ComL family)
VSLKLRKAFVLFFLTGLVSCSQFSTSPTSKAWHNMHAKYNALLIAKEDYKYASVLISNAEVFDQDLPILRIVDSTKLDSAKLYLTDAIKKASMIAERHSNSKYLDEAYLLLGKARVEKQEYFNAIETFKYLNATANSEAYKHAALIQLFRTYIFNDDLNNAGQVSEILKKQALSKKNKADFLITMAHFFKIQDQTAAAVLFLEEGLKSLPKGNGKARLHFCAGKMYESLGQNIAARKQYNLALKNKPNYNLEFNAKMGLIGTESLAKSTSQSFEDVLNDRKNQDLKSVIYIKMGDIEKRKKKYAQSLVYYTAAAKDALATDKLKAEAYKAASKVYLDDLLDYQNASLYIDSTLTFVSSTDKTREELLQKKQYLNDYVRYKLALDLEDSLQILSKINPLELDEKLKKIADDQINSVKKSQLSPETATPTSLTTNVKKLTWIMYDPVASVKAKNEFVRIWGNRLLEDNWRRQEKSTGSFSIKIERVKNVQVEEKSDETIKAEEALKQKAELETLVGEMKRKIPFSEVQMLASKRKQEEAIYQIGKIYNLRFKNQEKAKTYFKRLLDEHPGSIYEPEVAYAMALFEESGYNSSYGQLLQTKHPLSSFTRLLRVGVSKFDTSKETEVTEKYNSLFRIFEKEDYQNCLDGLDQSLEKYLGSQLEDKMAMLRIQCLKKLGKKEAYTISLTDFVRSYPNSDLLPTAKSLLSVLY